MKNKFSILLGAALCLLMTLTTAHAAGKGKGGGGGGGGGDQTATAKIAIWAPVVVDRKTGQTSLEVLALEPDGSRAKQLTTQGGGWPAWSSDQKYVSYCSGNPIAGGYWIYVQDVKSGYRFPVVPGRVGGHDWAPDDSAIVYTGTEAMGYGIWVVSVNPATGAVGEPVLLREGTCWDPQVSPDGTRIAFWLGGGRIIVLDLETGVETEFVGNAGSQPKWSPDGTRIAFAGAVCHLDENDPTNVICHSEIVISNPDGTGRVPVTALHSYTSNPIWSPDGTQIAFNSTISGSRALYKTTIGSGDVTLLYEGAEPGGDWAP